MGQGIDLAHGHAAVQVGAHVVRLGWRGVVHVAADVAVVVFGLDFTDGHAAGVGGYGLPGAVGVHDFVDVFGAQVVLRFAFAVFAVGVDEEHAALVALGIEALSGTGLVEHQDAGRYAGAIKQVAGQANDGLQVAFVDEVLARLALLATAKQHAVRHDGGQAAVGFEHGQHVLHKHEVGFFAFFGHPDRKASGELDVFFDVVLAERGVGQHAVKALELAVFGLVLWLAQGVLLADDGVRDAVQQHVHFANGPGGAHFFLPVQGQFRGVGPAFAQIVARLDQHAARADSGVVHAHFFLGVADLDADAHDFSRGVELTGFFTGGVGKVFDQPLVGGAQQVGEFKVFVFERDFVEVLDEVDERVVVQRVLADFAVEVDGAFEHVLQGIGVVVFERLQRFVEHGADVVFGVFEGRVVLAFGIDPRLVPAGARGHKEVFA